MKKITALSLVCLAATVCIFSAGASGQQLRFVNGDGSELTELCIAAASGTRNVNELATRLGIKSFTTGDVICNGMPLNKFVRRFREVREPETVIMSYRKTDESAETELCYAAVTFDTRFEQIKKSYLARHGTLDGVRCNDLTLERFIEKYSRKLLTAALR